MIQVRINNYKFYREHVILLLIKGSYFKVGRLKVKGKIYWILSNGRPCQISAPESGSKNQISAPSDYLVI